MPYFHPKSYVRDKIYDGPIAKSSLGPPTKKYDLAENWGYCCNGYSKADVMLIYKSHR